MSRQIIVILGKQGAGKGTQCTLLAQRHGLVHVSTGDILRAAVKDGTPLGLRVAPLLAAGELVPDDLVSGLVAERLAQPDAVKGALLDGFPRTHGQAEALDRVLGDDGVSLAVDIELADDLVTERLSSRRVCQECNAVYRASDPEGASGTCSACGGDVVQRHDDEPGAIRTRLAAYEQQTRPLLDFYGAKGLLATVDGSQSRDDVTAAIEDVFRSHGLS